MRRGALSLTRRLHDGCTIRAVGDPGLIEVAMRKLLRLALVAVFATGAFLLGAGGGSVADATASGPCTGTFNGVDVATRSATDPSQAIEVSSTQSVDAAATSAQAISTYEVQLSFSGLTWTVATGTANGTSWTRTVKVGDYSKFGVGLYQVHVISHGAASCESTFLVRVAGSPFRSIAGWMSLVLAGLGLGAGAMALTSGGQRSLRSKLALGAVGGLGFVGLSQEFAWAFPTPLYTALSVLGGAATPLLAHALGKSLFKSKKVGPSGGSTVQPDAAQPHGFAPPAPVEPAQHVLRQAGTQHGTSLTDPTTSHAHQLAAQHEVGGLQPGSGQQHAASGLQPGGGQQHVPAAVQGGHQAGTTLSSGFAANHVVPHGGLQTWSGSDSSAPGGQPLDAGLPIRLLHTVGDRVQIECSNGWRAWVAASAVGMGSAGE